MKNKLLLKDVQVNSISITVLGVISRVQGGARAKKQGKVLCFHIFLMNVENALPKFFVSKR